MKRNLLLKRDKGTSIPAYQVFANRIEDMIVGGDFKPGERLPTEIEFCERFGVNRSTVREGIRLLEQSGIVKRAGGKRLHACLPHFQDLGTRIGRALMLHRVTFRELWEASIAIETMTVAMAASRIRPFHLSALSKNIADMEMMISNPAEVVRLDIEFHNIIADITENRVIILAREPMSVLFYPSVGYLLESLKQSSRRLLDAHKKIFEYLETHQIENAQIWMRKHIVDFKRGYEIAGLDMNTPLRPWVS